MITLHSDTGINLAYQSYPRNTITNMEFFKSENLLFRVIKHCAAQVIHNSTFSKIHSWYVAELISTPADTNMSVVRPCSKFQHKPS